MSFLMLSPDLLFWYNLLGKMAGIGCVRVRKGCLANPVYINTRGTGEMAKVAAQGRGKESVG